MNAIVIILTIWFVAWAAFTGVGFLAHRLIAIRPFRTETWFSAFWVGWALCLGLLVTWHFYAPVGGPVLLLILIFGGVGFALNMKDLRVFWQHSQLRLHWVFFLGLALIAIWLANRCLGPINMGDMGLYHLPAVRWNTTFALVPGLGNLHSRLASSGIYYLYVGLFESGPLTGKSHHFANGLLLFMLTAQTSYFAYRWFRKRHSLETHEILTLLTGIYLPYQVFNFASNISNDLPIYILGTICGIQLCQLIFSAKSGPSEIWQVFTILVLCACGVAIKLSFAVLGFMLASVALFRWQRWRTCQGEPFFEVRLITWLLPAVMLLIWAGRNIMLSGYPFFPSTALGIDVPWQVSASEAELNARSVASWARYPQQPIQEENDWSWVANKLQKSFQRAPEFLLPMVLLGLGSLLHILQWKKQVLSRADWCSTALSTSFAYFFWPTLFLLPAFCALVFWFFTAPNIRFAGASFWLLGAGMFAISLSHTKRDTILASSCGLLITLFFVIYSFLYSPWITAAPDQGFIAAPIPATQTYTTQSGLILYIPIENDQCWNAPLPCTPYPNPALRLLKENQPGGGFSIQPIP